MTMSPRRGSRTRNADLVDQQHGAWWQASASCCRSGPAPARRRSCESTAARRSRRRRRATRRTGGPCRSELRIASVRRRPRRRSAGSVITPGRPRRPPRARARPTSGDSVCAPSSELDSIDTDVSTTSNSATSVNTSSGPTYLAPSGTTERPGTHRPPWNGTGGDHGRPTVRLATYSRMTATVPQMPASRSRFARRLREASLPHTPVARHRGRRRTRRRRATTCSDSVPRPDGRARLRTSRRSSDLQRLSASCPRGARRATTRASGSQRITVDVGQRASTAYPAGRHRRRRDR